jgi:hypothetical protein
MVAGGGISPSSVAPLRKVRQARLDRFETRKIIFDAAVLDGGCVDAALGHAMDFELLWLQNKREYYRAISIEDDARIGMIEARRRVPAPTRAAA